MIRSLSKPSNIKTLTCGLLAASLWLGMTAGLPAHAVLPSVIDAAQEKNSQENPEGTGQPETTQAAPQDGDPLSEGPADNAALTSGRKPAKASPLVIESLDADFLKAAPDVTKTGDTPDIEKLPASQHKDAAAEASDPTQEALSQLDPKTREALETLTETLHLQHRAIYNELRDEEELAAADIAMLWQAAVERSGTIRYAIEKLSRTTATGEPLDEDSFTKRIMTGMAQLGGIAGSMWTGTPAGVIGGGLVNDLISGDPSVSAMTRVTDADMLILAKEVEALQSELIRKYYEYRHAEEQWQLSREAHRTLSMYFEQQPAQNLSLSETELEKLDPESRRVLAQLTETVRQQQQTLRSQSESILAEIQNEETEAKRTYVSTRNALSLLVGRDAILAMEQSRQTSAARGNRSAL